MGDFGGQRLDEEKTDDGEFGELYSFASFSDGDNEMSEEEKLQSDWVKLNNDLAKQLAQGEKALGKLEEEITSHQGKILRKKSELDLNPPRPLLLAPSVETEEEEEYDGNSVQPLVVLEPAPLSSRHEAIQILESKEVTLMNHKRKLRRAIRLVQGRHNSIAELRENLFDDPSAPRPGTRDKREITNMKLESEQKQLDKLRRDLRWLEMIRDDEDDDGNSLRFYTEPDASQKDSETHSLDSREGDFDDTDEEESVR